MPETWQTFSVPNSWQTYRIFISVRESNAGDGLIRLRKDDPVWVRGQVRFEGEFTYDPSISRLRPRRGFIGWTAPLEAA